jgi:hypothetical protein
MTLYVRKCLKIEKHRGLTLSLDMLKLLYEMCLSFPFFAVYHREYLIETRSAAWVPTLGY